MKTIKNYIVLMLLGLSYLTFGQQDPQYTQYMYNQAIINPAYAGSKEHLSIVALYRNQWTGLDGAPETPTFSAHTRIKERIGVGLSFINDRHGPVRENNVYADFSYTIPVGEDLKLALGLKAGATFHNIGLVDLAIIDPNDPLFAADVSSTSPNFGTGAFFYSEKYYVGVAMPNMLNTVHLDVNGRKFGSEVQHLFAMGGYVFQLTDNIKFKPSTMMKFQFDSPLSFDVNANFLFHDRLETGVSYRHQDSFSALVNFAITPKLRMGYAYDHIVSDIVEAASSSHEIFIQYDLIFPKKISRSPRFF